MDIKVNFFFQLRANGWSETYYTQANDLATGYTNAEALATARAMLLASPADLSYIRVSEVGGTRRSTLTAVGIEVGGFGQFNPNYQSKCSQAQDAVLLTLYATAVSKQRPLYIHGWADDVYNLALPGNADAQLFFNKLTAFRGNFMPQGKWFIRYTEPLDVTVDEPIITMGPAVITSQTTLSVANPIPGLAVGDYVVTFRTGTRPRMGRQRVVAIDNTNLNIDVPYTLLRSFTYQPGGFMNKYVPLMSVLDSSNFRGFVSHKVGRPFGVSRGRRPSIHP